MKNNINTQVIMQRKTRTVIPKVSSHVQEVIDLGHKNLWEFAIYRHNLSNPDTIMHLQLGLIYLQ